MIIDNLLRILLTLLLLICIIDDYWVKGESVPCLINKDNILNCSKDYEPSAYSLEIKEKIAEIKATSKKQFQTLEIDKSVWNLLIKASKIIINIHVVNYTRNFFPNDLQVEELTVYAKRLYSCTFKQLTNLTTLEIINSERDTNIYIHNDALIGLNKLKIIRLYGSKSIESFPDKSKGSSVCEQYLCAARSLKRIFMEVKLPCIELKLDGIPSKTTVTPMKYDMYTEVYSEAICSMKYLNCNYSVPFDSCGKVDNCLTYNNKEETNIVGIKASSTGIILLVILVILLAILAIAIVAYFVKAKSAQHPIPTAVPT